jgi:hypothetical protein
MNLALVICGPCSGDVAALICSYLETEGCLDARAFL